MEMLNVILISVFALIALGALIDTKNVVFESPIDKVLIVLSILVVFSLLNNMIEKRDQELMKIEAYECYKKTLEEACFLYYLYPDTEFTKHGFKLP